MTHPNKCTPSQSECGGPRRHLRLLFVGARTAPRFICFNAIGMFFRVAIVVSVIGEILILKDVADGVHLNEKHL